MDQDDARGHDPEVAAIRQAEKLARLVSEHHKAVQLNEIEQRLRGLEEALGLVPGPWMMSLGVSASDP